MRCFAGVGIVTMSMAQLIRSILRPGFVSCRGASAVTIVCPVVMAWCSSREAVARQTRAVVVVGDPRGSRRGARAPQCGRGRAYMVRAPRGYRTVNAAGYVLLRNPDHLRAHNNGYVYEHILIAEAAFGKPLPRGAQIHHVNGSESDNRPCNLIICQDHAYHMRLHRRKRALDACGDPDWRRCKYCKGWDRPENLYITTKEVRHRRCHASYEARRQGDQRRALDTRTGASLPVNEFGR